jgi:hypothetical protein
MNKYILIILVFTVFSCEKEVKTTKQQSTKADSLQLVKMISERERSMIDKDITSAMSQFSDDVTWINSQGYYFQGKSEVLKFHHMLAENDSLDYDYQAGTPRIRIIDFDNAIAYYSWKMFWYKKEIPTDTVIKEIGLMTLNARKYHDNWKWIAITNQHTPWFYNEIEPVFID